MEFAIDESLQIMSLRDPISRWLSSLDFSRLLLDGMLSFLLFAGAIQIDGTKLRQFAWQVGFLAVISTALSAAFIGCANLLARTAVVEPVISLARGISVALALSLPAGPEREIVLLLTYGNVVFSTFAQGLSVEWFAKKTYERADEQMF